MMRTLIRGLLRLALLDLYVLVWTERLFQHARHRVGRPRAATPESSYAFSTAFWVLVAALPLAYSAAELYAFFTQPEPLPVGKDRQA